MDAQVVFQNWPKIGKLKKNPNTFLKSVEFRWAAHAALPPLNDRCLTAVINSNYPSQECSVYRLVGNKFIMIDVGYHSGCRDLLMGALLNILLKVFKYSTCLCFILIKYFKFFFFFFVVTALKVLMLQISGLLP